MIELSDVLAARACIAPIVQVTPCMRSEKLSRLLDCELHLKLENLQMTGSFKERGVGNRLASLSQAERAAGVVAASAGNHAQALAFGAQRLGIAATVVMPVSTPLIKVSNTRSYGAKVLLHGASYSDAATEAARLATEHGATLVPAFDDDAVIAGQGTIGLELLEQVPNLDAVVVPVGGGGLISGIATAIKTQRPEVALYGVEAAAVPSMQAALDAGAPTLIEAAPTLADGIAVRRVCTRTLEIVQRHVDQLVSVHEEDIAHATLLLLEQDKTVAEGAGAVPLAAALQGSLPLSGKRVVLVVSGGNIDVNVLSRIIDRGLVQSGRCMQVSVLIPDVPGSLAKLLATIGGLRANVLQAHHDRLSARTALGLAAVELVLETRGFDHIDEIKSTIEQAGWIITD